MWLCRTAMTPNKDKDEEKLRVIWTTTRLVLSDIFFFFFCVPMILASCQVWSPVALINSTVCVRLYSVPFSLSLRVLARSVILVLHEVGNPRVCAQLFERLPHGQLGLVPILNFVCMCFLRRLCPERRRNIMV